MAQRHVLEMAADELWQEWRKDIARIRQDIHELFSSRRTFRDVADVFRKNSRLQAVGGHLWDWMRVSYASYVVMRVRRETDEQGNTVNLNQLLREIELRPDVVTRERFIGMLNIGKEREWLEAVNQDCFTETWMAADSSSLRDPADRLDPARLKRDREALQEAVERVCEVGNKQVAHRTRVDVQTLTIPEVDAAFSAIEEMLKKYYVLLHGASLMGAEPTPQFDTHEVFTFAWLDPEPTDR